MKVVKRDPGKWGRQDVSRYPDEALLAPRKVVAREQVDRPRAERERDRLNDDERLRPRDDRIERNDQKERWGEVIEKERVRIAPFETQRRFDEAAVHRIPEHLVEHAEIERGRVERPMPNERERAEDERVEHDDPECDPLFVPVERGPDSGAA